MNRVDSKWLSLYAHRMCYFRAVNLHCRNFFASLIFVVGWTYENILHNTKLSPIYGTRQFAPGAYEPLLCDAQKLLFALCIFVYIAYKYISLT